MGTFKYLVLGTALTTAIASATPLGTSITISDKNIKAPLTGWYGDHEDNETEGNPTTLKGQKWDLEGIYLDGKALTMVGGYDFRNGASHNGITYRSGDLFIDTNGDMVYGYPTLAGSGTGGTTTNSFGYDYAIDFNDAMTKYTVYKLTSSSLLSRVTDVPSSNAWRYISGGSLLGPAQYQDLDVEYGSLTAAVYSVLTTYGSTGTGLQGYEGNNNHYYLGVDLTFLPHLTEATFHYTFECGNDSIIGHGTVVPDGGSTTLLLLGGLSALALLRRKAKRVA